MSAHPLDIIAAPPPKVPEPAIATLLVQEYSVAGTLAPLVSERDQNFRLETDDGRVLVVKIANAAEPREVTDFQIRALQHLETNACLVPVPKVVTTNAGAASMTIRSGDATHVLRVVSYLPGTPLENARPGPELAFELGAALAQLDRSLAGFSHPGESQVLLWDMQRAGQLRDLLHHVPDPDVMKLATACLDRFETVAAPAFASLRSQVIHNDLNPGNVLVAGGRIPAVSGVIDFGDMLRAPLVVDLAIAASYLRVIDDELSATRSLLAGFESVTPLDETERELLYDLIRTRLATTITILYWRASVRSANDPYLEKALQERSSERFLVHLSGLGRRAFAQRVFFPKI